MMPCPGSCARVVLSRAVISTVTSDSSSCRQKSAKRYGTNISGVVFRLFRYHYRASSCECACLCCAQVVNPEHGHLKLPAPCATSPPCRFLIRYPCPSDQAWRLDISSNYKQVCQSLQCIHQGSPCSDAWTFLVKLSWYVRAVPFHRFLATGGAVRCDSADYCS
jgi:hypothetical protein